MGAAGAVAPQGRLNFLSAQRTGDLLAETYRLQGEWEEARALLAPIYGWFTEGFDTADLQEAQALLEG